MLKICPECGAILRFISKTTNVKTGLVYENSHCPDCGGTAQYITNIGERQPMRVIWKKEPSILLMIPRRSAPYPS